MRRDLLNRVEALEATLGRAGGAQLFAQALRDAGYDVNDPAGFNGVVVVRECDRNDRKLRAKLDDLQPKYPGVLVVLVDDLRERTGCVPHNVPEEDC